MFTCYFNYGEGALFSWAFFRTKESSTTIMPSNVNVINSILYVSNAGPENEGYYICSVKTDNGIVEDYATLKVDMDVLGSDMLMRKSRKHDCVVLYFSGFVSTPNSWLTKLSCLHGLLGFTCHIFSFL